MDLRPDILFAWITAGARRLRAIVHLPRFLLQQIRDAYQQAVANAVCQVIAYQRAQI